MRIKLDPENLNKDKGINFFDINFDRICLFLLMPLESTYEYKNELKQTIFSNEMKESTLNVLMDIINYACNPKYKEEFINFINLRCPKKLKKLKEI